MLTSDRYILTNRHMTEGSGNGGRLLLEASGAVIGVNTAVSSEGEGLAFGIPISAAASLIAQAVGASVS